MSQRAAIFQSRKSRIEAGASRPAARLLPGPLAYRVLAAYAAATLGGCSAGAPSLVLFGSYFPAWLACAIIGVLTALLVRILFVASGLSEALPYQLLLCAASGAIVSLLVARLGFGI